MPSRRRSARTNATDGDPHQDADDDAGEGEGDVRARRQSLAVGSVRAGRLSDRRDDRVGHGARADDEEDGDRRLAPGRLREGGADVGARVACFS